MRGGKALERARSLLAPWAATVAAPEQGRLDVVLAGGAQDLRDAAHALRDGRWGYLAAITGLDMAPDGTQMEALYHFCEGAAVLTLRVQLPREAPRLPSIGDLFPVAAFYEIELSEMFGIHVAGVDGADHLFLPESWPAGLYPLRKDAELPRPEPRRQHAQQ